MIAVAKQVGSSVEVYDENGNFIFNKSGTLVGFSGSTVAVQNGSTVEVYDENGNFLFNK